MEPHAHIAGKTPKANQSRAVLREALQWYGRRPSPTLSGFLGALADLPDGVSVIANARDRAAELSQNLRAAMVNDPMFGGDGAPGGPGTAADAVGRLPRQGVGDQHDRALRRHPA